MGVLKCVCVIIVFVEVVLAASVALGLLLRLLWGIFIRRFAPDWLIQILIQWKNSLHYHWYKHKNQKWLSVCTFFQFIGMVGTLVSWLTSGFNLNKIITSPEPAVNSLLLFVSIFLFIVPFVISVAAQLYEWLNNYSDSFVTIKEDNVYKDVLPPNDGWKRIDLKIKVDGGGEQEETIYTCDGINQWLQNGVKLKIKRDRLYERKLKKKIRDSGTWMAIYKPFLRQNYRNSTYEGKQFHNEAKYGLSEELVPGMEWIRVHKTCYFDTFLTNIIPGKKLENNQTLRTVTPAPPCPIYKDGDHFCLYELGDEGEVTANELGVTTLCIYKDNKIRLWRQNSMAQCSTGLIVASGSGSADWEDCKKHLKKRDGFQNAIIDGMERELWEESHKAAKSKEVIKYNVDTRITGYFRWLKKGGKSEFVGVSRMKDDDNNSIRRSRSPEKTEVSDTRGGASKTDPGILDASSIAKLCIEIEKRVILQDKDEDEDIDGKIEYVSNSYSVSCSAALLALKSVCEKFCESCEDEQCSSKKDKTYKEKNCKKVPFDVLF